MDEQSSRDLLSDLPLSIIHTILEHVPIRDAVKTSLLSRQWRYKWVTLPHLTFDEKSFSTSTSQVKDFINQVLLLHQGHILKFKLDVPFAECFQNVNQWLNFLSRNGIRMLFLKYYGDDHFQILSTLYSCQNLSHLEIFHCKLAPPTPTFKGFLCLRSLKLEMVCVSSNTIQTLLANQNLLEELMLDNCSKDLDLRTIHAPKLKILHLRGVFNDICSLYAPLLREMSVNFANDLPQKKSSSCSYTEFLGGLTNLEKLKGSLYFFKYLSIGIESCDVPLVLPRLKIIELTPECFYDKKVESVVAHLLKSAPNLHKIRLSYSHSCGSHLASTVWNSECPFNLTFERLKVIELRFLCANNWMELIKCLLASSPLLETLIYERRPSFSDTQLLMQACTLLAYPRASSNAKILFV